MNYMTATLFSGGLTVSNNPALVINQADTANSLYPFLLWFRVSKGIYRRKCFSFSGPLFL